MPLMIFGAVAYPVAVAVIHKPWPAIPFLFCSLSRFPVFTQANVAQCPACGVGGPVEVSSELSLVHKVKRCHVGLSFLGSSMNVVFLAWSNFQPHEDNQMRSLTLFSGGGGRGRKWREHRAVDCRQVPAGVRGRLAVCSVPAVHTKAGQILFLRRQPCDGQLQTALRRDRHQ